MNTQIRKFHYSGEMLEKASQSLSSDRPEPMLSELRNVAVEMPFDPQPREINIQPLNYGYVVRVGCQTLGIESKDTLIKNLVAYLENPGEYESKYMSSKKLQ